MAATLDDLIAGLPQNLSNQIMSPEQQQAAIEAQVSAAMPAMLRKYGQTAQQQNEAAFGKGMGLSTWNAYQQALNSLLQTEAAGQIRQNATNDMAKAQEAAIGNAVSYATSEKNRAASTATNSANNAAAAERQQAALRAQGKMNTRNQIYGGASAAAGGIGGLLGREFKPEIGEGLRKGAGAIAGMFGSPKTESAPSLQELAAGSAGSAEAGGAGPASSFTASPPNSFDISPSGFDLSGNYDTGFNLSPLDYSFNTPDFGLDSLINSPTFNWGDYF